MKGLIILLSIGMVVLSCHKKFETPAIDPVLAGASISLEDLIASYQGSPINFNDSLSVYATVTMDESDGNLYKSTYIQAGDFALNVRLLSAGGLYVGDSIRIDLKGTVLSTYNGVLQLDAVHADNNIVKLAVDKDIKPLALSVSDVNPNLQSRLIKLENVQFIYPEIGGTYAFAEDKESKDIMVEDCDGNTVWFSNSGYANFADELVAEGNGSIMAIVGMFNGDVQLIIRSFDEIKMDAERCAGQYIVKDFNDELISTGGWHMEQIVGSDTWETNDQGAASFYCQISNFDGSNNIACESWLVSPAIDLSLINTPGLSFINASNYQGTNLEVYISTNYSGAGDPNIATWATLNPILSSGGWEWVNSGIIDLSAYTNENVVIAFKYIGSSSDGKTWEIDDIVISGKT
ncbi:hypothetical protein DNU06_08875 [Putridiphycobacter roseus]|uniref:DUF5689 domain-containing protein n=1 Tax=Putridiphycobacter roseus TaxID=2219161 RepID=A0A2W1N0T0_9FLAO|nr:DUF5689 domain-containing protein [Putridiphycobacter roseus]PZE17374.1 hypothetical protein DNU06_08875 [Putridiphycobacter roseus]